MDGSIALAPGQRKRLLGLYRKPWSPHHVRLRAHIVLLLADGQPWSLIVAVLFCSTATVARWRDRFEAGGVAALLADDRGRRPTLGGWAALAARWVRERTPRSFGCLRSRWCCLTVCLVLRLRCHVRVSQETVRRWLHRDGLVWRRPRPVPGPMDPRRPQKPRAIRDLLRTLPPDEAAVFQDEVDLNLNPDVGCAWMPRGGQAEVVTPGTNVKRYLAGSMSWRTGELVVTQGGSRDANLFCRHLDDLRRAFRRHRVIHVVCDNARFRTAAGSKVVRAYLAEWGHRVVLHYLPAYSPQDNPVERAWWHLHEQVTRNHACRTIDELTDLTMRWIEQHDRGRFKIEGAMYERLKKAAA